MVSAFETAVKFRPSQSNTLAGKPGSKAVSVNGAKWERSVVVICSAISDRVGDGIKFIGSNPRLSFAAEDGARFSNTSDNPNSLTATQVPPKSPSMRAKKRTLSRVRSGGVDAGRRVRFSSRLHSN